MKFDTSVVLTNGAWHGSWCWSLTIAQLNRLGCAATAVELDGFGGLSGATPSTCWTDPEDRASFLTAPSAVAEATLDSVATKFVTDLERLSGGEPSIVVAHSLGGVVITEAAQRRPDLFRALIFLSAMTPVAGLASAAYQSAPEMAESLLPSIIVADPGELGAVRADFVTAEGRELAKRSFYHDVPDGLADRAISMLATDAPARVSQPVLATADVFGSIPRSWLVCTKDRIIPPAMQRRLVRELDEMSSSASDGVMTDVYELDSSHSPFLSMPDHLATVIADIAGRA